MWQSETKPFTYTVIYLGSGTTSDLDPTVNIAAGITLAEGIRIKADKENGEAILVTYNGGGSYNLYASEEVFIPTSNPGLVELATAGDDMDYSFIAW